MPPIVLIMLWSVAKKLITPISALPKMCEPSRHIRCSSSSPSSRPSLIWFPFHLSSTRFNPSCFLPLSHMLHLVRSSRRLSGASWWGSTLRNSKRRLTFDTPWCESGTMPNRLHFMQAKTLKASWSRIASPKSLTIDAALTWHNEIWNSSPTRTNIWFKSFLSRSWRLNTLQERLNSELSVKVPVPSTTFSMIYPLLSISLNNSPPSRLELTDSPRLWLPFEKQILNDPQTLPLCNFPTAN
mmetsp:Transcript_13115/g.23771  ORF Transcript_13115/g.23771 Transcript_13115/m.23771 type:complete len:241 (+) Transcript_13115:576-1298(+)